MSSRKGPARITRSCELKVGATIEGLWAYWHRLQYDSTAVLWLVIAVVMLVLFARRPIEFRWLALTSAFAIPAEIILTFAYSQSFG